MKEREGNGAGGEEGKGGQAALSLTRAGRRRKILACHEQARVKPIWRGCTVTDGE
jgi:hypothetical protein